MYGKFLGIIWKCFCGLDLVFNVTRFLFLDCNDFLRSDFVEHNPDYCYFMPRCVWVVFAPCRTAFGLLFVGLPIMRGFCFLVLSRICFFGCPVSCLSQLCALVNRLFYCRLWVFVCLILIVIASIKR